MTTRDDDARGLGGRRVTRISGLQRDHITVARLRAALIVAAQWLAVALGWARA